MVFKHDNLARRQHDIAKYSLTTPRQQIELKTIVGTKWNSWMGSRFDEHPDIQYARLISVQRVAFYDLEYETSIFYPGERFLRQVLGEIVIPMSPRQPLKDLTNIPETVDVIVGEHYVFVDEIQYGGK
ncbi:hypothetical protein MKX01_003893 [Papaver californicum]|nr:hypothetical protein MKX01_003893 [Papaver californicum]